MRSFLTWLMSAAFALILMISRVLGFASLSTLGVGDYSYTFGSYASSRRAHYSNVSVSPNMRSTARPSSAVVVRGRDADS